MSIFSNCHDPAWRHYCPTFGDKEQIRKWAQESGKPCPQAHSQNDLESGRTSSSVRPQASLSTSPGPLLTSTWSQSWVLVEGSSGRFSYLGKHLHSCGRSLWFTARSGICALDSILILSPIHVDEKLMMRMSPSSKSGEENTPLE